MKNIVYVIYGLLLILTSCTKDEDDTRRVGIHSMEDLIAFCDAVNSGQDLSQWQDETYRSVTLYTDIDLGDWEWEPIDELTGIFDGNNHVIRLKKSQTEPHEVWGFVRKNSGIIKNLRIEANFQMDTFKASDGIGNTVQHVGSICYTNGGLITNTSVKIYGDNLLNGVAFGGIASVNTNVGTIESCYIEGKLSGANLIVGGICYSNDGIVKDCRNAMTIDATESRSFDCIGGLVACNRANGQVLNCINEADILSQDTYISFYGIGGIVARMFGGTVNGCSNKGRIVGNELGHAFGGIVGNASEVYSSDKVQQKRMIIQCLNSGSVTGREGVTGGIVGCIAGEESSIDGCQNEGTVNGEGGSLDNAIGTDMR